MSRPDWKDAPTWANWLAKDSYGAWFWHEKEPRSNHAGWWGEEYDKSEFAGVYHSDVYYTDTLEKRPTSAA